MAFSDALPALDRLVTQQFGGTVQYSWGGLGPWTSVPGVFTENYVAASAMDVGVATTAPALWLSAAARSTLQFDPATERGVVFDCGGTLYKTIRPETDGSGGVLLFLQEA